MKNFFIGLFTVITFISALTYFVSCLTPFISPVYFWPMAFLALSFPYLAVCIILLAFIWIFIRRKIALFLFLLLFVGCKNLFATFALSTSSYSGTNTYTGSLRVLTWNVRSFDNPTAAADSFMGVRRQMFRYLEKTKPDVLCLQEFSEHLLPSYRSNTKDLNKLGYIYSYRTNEVCQHYGSGVVQSGTAIFSKVPIHDSGKVMLGDRSYPEHIAYIDILFENKPLRIFASHFKSINLFATKADAVNKVIFHGDPNLVYEGTKFEKLKVFAQDHARESVIAKNAVNKSPYPAIIGMDMNSVPTSYPYHIMSEGLQDAFRSNNWGLGTTLDSLPKTLRIDFFLVDKRLSIKNYEKDEVHLSDHFPQFIDVKWKE